MHSRNYDDSSTPVRFRILTLSESSSLSSVISKPMETTQKVSSQRFVTCSISR